MGSVVCSESRCSLCSNTKTNELTEVATAGGVIYEAPSLQHGFGSSTVTILTWNIAAVNNNPFEYWIQYGDPEYLELMQGVEAFIDDPQDHDIPVSSVFTDAMFGELMTQMKAVNLGGSLDALDEVQGEWEGGALGLRNRKVVSGFIKDKELGAKRLISMPDRVTNTINVVSAGTSRCQLAPACRPCVINNYLGDLSSLKVWWQSWQLFMFNTKLNIKTRDGVKAQTPAEMLEPIPRSKYPAVTEKEERLAIPLQLVCQAIFDSVLVHLMNRLSVNGNWQVIKQNIYDKLFKTKNEKTIEILAKVYCNVDVLCLQEVAAVFIDKVSSSELYSTHSIVFPSKLDGKRDQNSVVMLRQGAFRKETIREVSDMLPKMEVADGDLIAVEAVAQTGQKHLIISFHGDTNGLMTLPVVHCIHDQVQKSWPDHIVIMGLDANVYEKPAKDKLQFETFMSELSMMGMSCAFGDAAIAANCRTTCNARTSLQPQLNKAIRWRDRISQSDMNPKDNIVFYKRQLIPLLSDVPSNPIKDNTGKMQYLEENVFPSLEFPSDHGIVVVALGHK